MSIIRNVQKSARALDRMQHFYRLLADIDRTLAAPDLPEVDRDILRRDRVNIARALTAARNRFESAQQAIKFPREV